MSCGFDEVAAAVEAQKPVIVDVRTEDEFASGRIPGAKNIPLSEVILRVWQEQQDRGSIRSSPRRVLWHRGGWDWWWVEVAHCNSVPVFLGEVIGT